MKPKLSLFSDEAKTFIIFWWSQNFHYFLMKPKLHQVLMSFWVFAQSVWVNSKTVAGMCCVHQILLFLTNSVLAGGRRYLHCLCCIACISKYSHFWYALDKLDKFGTRGRPSGWAKGRVRTENLGRVLRVSLCFCCRWNKFCVTVTVTMTATVTVTVTVMTSEGANMARCQFQVSRCHQPSMTMLTSHMLAWVCKLAWMPDSTDYS